MTLPDRILAARALLETETPLKGDCGRRCGAACCKPDEDGQGGMLLFPGEETLYDPLPQWASLTRSGVALQGREVFFLTCDSTCPREHRPLACRIFPLTPVVTEDGRLHVEPDVRAWPICPLMPFGMEGLSRGFVGAVDAAMRMIDGDPLGHAYLVRLTHLLDAFRGGMTL